MIPKHLWFVWRLGKSVTMWGVVDSCKIGQATEMRYFVVIINLGGIWIDELITESLEMCGKKVREVEGRMRAGIYQKCIIRISASVTFLKCKFDHATSLPKALQLTRKEILCEY